MFDDFMFRIAVDLLGVAFLFAGAVLASLINIACSQTSSNAIPRGRHSFPAEWEFWNFMNIPTGWAKR